jgi:hypothetical protein
MGVEIRNGLWRASVFALAKVCVRARDVIVQIHTHLVRVVFGSSWLGIVFVKP